MYPVSQPAEAGGMQIGCGALQVHAPSTRHSGCFKAWKLAEVQERPRRRSTHAKARRLYNGRDKLPQSHIDALASRAMCRKLTHCYPVRKVEFAFRGPSWHVPRACSRPFTRVLTCSNAPLNPKHSKYPLSPYQHQDSIPRTVHPMDAVKLRPPHNRAGLALAHRADYA